MLKSINHKRFTDLAALIGKEAEGAALEGAALIGKNSLPWEQILYFKKSSHFEKGPNCRESLLDTVVYL